MSTVVVAPTPPEPLDAACCDHCEHPAPPPTGVNLRGWFTAAAAALLLVACAIDWLTLQPAWITPLFAVAAIVGAVFPAQRAFGALKKGNLDINALMVIAVAGAMAIGQFEEAAMVVSLFALAQWLEAQTMDRARKAIRRLLDLAPADVLVREASGERRVGIDTVKAGALMIVRPGEKIPLDGTVFEGRSDVNQAPITGESLPVEKGAGDEVFAGTINGHGVLVATVTRRRPDTTLARIVNLVESAQAQRAPTQLFIDRFAAWYTPAVIVTAALVATVPVFVFAQPFETWLYRSLVLLVVGCPCALVISTPVSIVSALSAAARHGVLIKGGAHLERLAGIRVAAFDKTGTLTTGALRVAMVQPAPGVDENELVAVAAAVESQSEHPVAAAIVRDARDRGLSFDPPRGVRAMPGLGIEGTSGGTLVVCGTPRLFEERGLMTSEWTDRAAGVTASGASPVLVERNGALIGVIGLADTHKAVARDAVASLHALGVSRVALLTGDQINAARTVALEAGIEEVRAALLPEDKVSAVKELRNAYGAIAMIGDGVNDAPALAAADVGIVMGGMGSQAAVETADMALMTDDLAKLPYAVRLSRATLANVRANVTIAVGLKLLFVALAATGVATLWMAVLADTGASAIVVANAVRLRRFN